MTLQWGIAFAAACFEKGFLPPSSFFPLGRYTFVLLNSTILSMLTEIFYSIALLGMGAINLTLAQQTSGQFQVISLSGGSIGYLSIQEGNQL
jgi:hypothetical protein